MYRKSVKPHEVLKIHITFEKADFDLDGIKTVTLISNKWSNMTKYPHINTYFKNKKIFKVSLDIFNA